MPKSRADRASGGAFIDVHGCGTVQRLPSGKLYRWPELHGRPVAAARSFRLADGAAVEALQNFTDTEARSVRGSTG